ncbi:MAG: hypothetical protein JOZ41_15955, partial [Chloroflexi bacterium]|nr:hypothetical protein [Chloroflexota bacterium]
AYAEYRGLGWPVLRIPYEELVTSPEPVLRRALSFLGLSWHPDVLRHHSLLHTEASGEVTVGGTAIRRPVDAASVGRWSGVLDAPQLREIESIGGPGRSPTLSPDLPRGERARLTGNW